jgi:hypothetical protein
MKVVGCAIIDDWMMMKMTADAGDPELNVKCKPRGGGAHILMFYIIVSA